jgi:hypothetical protein
MTANCKKFEIMTRVHVTGACTNNLKLKCIILNYRKGTDDISHSKVKLVGLIGISSFYQMKVLPIFASD